MFDLSSTTKLKHLKFSGVRTGLTVQWITTALQSVKSKNIQNIVINPDDNILEPDWEQVHQEWQDLDRLLVQLCMTHSIRPQLIYKVRNEGKVVPDLLPELTRRGMVDIFETPPSW